MRKLLPILLGLLGLSSAAMSQNFMAPTGPVYASVQSGNTLYLGGAFTAVGYNRPYMTVVDTGTGNISQFETYTNGPVTAIAPDGAGGWYIGGYFTQVISTTRNGAAHIDANGQVTSWNPNLNGGSGRVNCIIATENAVFIGGNFTNSGSTLVRGFAVYDKVTGQLKTPQRLFGGVSVISISSFTMVGNKLAVTGNFTNHYLPFVSGSEILLNGLALVDTTTGVPTAFNANITSGSVSNCVFLGNKLFVAGSFSSIGGQLRNNIAALDTAAGNATSWNPSSNASITGMTEAGGKIFVSGNFSTIGGQTRDKFAAIDTATGNLTAFYNNQTGGAPCANLVVSGGLLYVGGNFLSLGGQPRFGVAALDTATGVVTNFNAGLSTNTFISTPPASFNSRVNCLAEVGGKLFIGGVFNVVNAVSREGFAAINLTTGKVKENFNPGGGDIRSLLVYGHRLYAGGNFTTIGGESRSSLAALDTANGLATSFNPSVSGSVYALTAESNKLYFGGTFEIVGVTARNHAAAVDTGTGTLTNWNPNVSAVVNAMASMGRKVFIGGAYTSVGGQSRTCLAAVDSSAGNLLPWIANTSTSNNTSRPVYALASIGKRIVAGGVLTDISQIPQASTPVDLIAVLDTASGAVLQSPLGTLGAINQVNALYVKNSKIYLGGRYFGVKAFDTTTSALTGFSGDIVASQNGPQSEVRTIAVSGDSVFAGGFFRSTVFGTTKNSNFGIFVDGQPLPTTLYSFTAKKGAANHTALLNWKVGTELDLCCYGVERSTDGTSFREIGFVPAANRKEYSLTDNDAANGLNYYRIRIEDKNGTAKYSATATVAFSRKGSVSAMPVPTRGVVTITNTDASLSGQQAEIINLQGRIVSRFQLAAQQQIDMQAWAAGLYILRLPDGQILKLQKL